LHGKRILRRAEGTSCLFVSFVLLYSCSVNSSFMSEDNFTDSQDNLAVDSDSSLNFRNNGKSYFIKQGGAISETQKEFQMFQFYLETGSGRSTLYIANVFNLSDSRINEIAKRNYWIERSAEYDRDMLAEKIRSEQNARAIEHKRKLEQYRETQEFLGRSLTNDAAKLAMLASRTLDDYINSERQIDMRDIPSILNSAAKIAEVGKSLQSGALGVEQLLVALEEADFDE
jgi:Mor family transcriptional regulator